MTRETGPSENLKAVSLMVLAMALFALSDALIKVISQNVSTGQIIFLMGLGGAPIFAVMLYRAGDRFFPKEAFGAISLTRNGGEVLGAIGFISALATGDLAVVSSVLQATPLAVTAAAAILLGETVGPRRWAAVMAGFIGVLLIIQPGMAGFNFATVLALIGMIGLTLRDIMTRIAPKTLSNRQLAFYGFTVLIPSGWIMMIITGGWGPMRAMDWLMMLGVIGFAVSAYYAVTMAVRLGEVSFVTPFRYTRIVFAMLLGSLVFAEPIDSLTALGITIVVASGLYTMWRERTVVR